MGTLAAYVERTDNEMMRARWGVLWLVWVAIAASCSPTVESSSDDTLHDAAGKGDLARVTLLVDQGADVNAIALEGGSVLHHAALSGNADLVAYLLRAGADPKARTLRGETALHWGASRGSVEVVRLLIKAGLDVNAVNEDGETALDLAGTTEGAFPELVRALQQAGAKRGDDLE